MIAYLLGLVLMMDNPAYVTTPSPFTVRVVDADGKPVPGAAIYLVAGSPLTFRLVTLWHGHSDLEGLARVDRSRWIKEDVAPIANLLVYKEKFRIARTEVRSGPIDQPTRVVLRPTVDVHIRVLGPRGEAIPGARVRPGTSLVMPEDLRDRLAVMTGADGRAITADVEESGGFFRDVSTAGFGTQRVNTQFADQEVILPLRQVGKLTGRVITADPVRARGLVISGFTNPVSPLAGIPKVTGKFEATTDVEGRFEVLNLASGRVIVSSSRLAPDLAHVPDAVAVLEEGGHCDITVILEKGVPIRGKIRERGTNRPIAGALIRLSSSPPDPGFRLVRTNTAGEYEAFLLPGEIMLDVFYADPFVPAIAPTKSRYFFLGLLQENAKELEVPPFEFVCNHK